MKVTRLNTRRDVKDAKEDLILEILPRDVRGASLKSPDKCAAALACNRQLGREARIHISRVYIKENGGTTWLRYVTSKPLRTEVIAFDRGGSFMPGSYLLKAPSRMKRLGADNKRIRKGTLIRRKKRAYRTVKDVRTGPANGA